MMDSEEEEEQTALVCDNGKFETTTKEIWSEICMSENKKDMVTFRKMNFKDLYSWDFGRCLIKVHNCEISSHVVKPLYSFQNLTNMIFLINQFLACDRPKKGFLTHLS